MDTRDSPTGPPEQAAFFIVVPGLRRAPRFGGQEGSLGERKASPHRPS